MRETAISCSEPEVAESPVNPEGGHLWAIVLAGGEGVRLRPLTRELYGEPRPKQYAARLAARPCCARPSIGSDGWCRGSVR